MLLLAGMAAGLLADGMYGDLNPAGDELRPPTPLVVIEEGGGALLGGAVGGFAMALAGGYMGSRLNSGPTDDINWTPLLYAGYSAALIGFPLGSATGSYLMGSLEKQGGAWWASMLGAYAGTAAGIGLAYLGYRSGEAGRDYIAVPLYVLAGVAPLSGAVAGYNVSTPCLRSRCYEERFAATGLDLELAQTEREGPRVRVQLLSLRI